MKLLRTCLRWGLQSARNLLVAHPKIRVFLYDMTNRNEFGNLYEHEKMLADAVRVGTYRKAIEKLIGTEDVVLDLGTGTGILALFAARQNPRKIYAIDHSEFIATAKAIAAHNRIKDIEFVQINSRNFNPDQKLDVILHEQIGDYLFNENMIQNILDLRDRLLKPGGRILPGRFELFLEPVAMQTSFKTPFIWEQELFGIDFSFLKQLAGDLAKFTPVTYRQEWLEAAAVKHFLCTPTPLLKVDLHQLSSEKDIPRTVRTVRTVETPGPLDGFCLFFKVIFDDEIQFDTSPWSANTHWGNCFFRVERQQCEEGEGLDVELALPDLLDITTWSVASPGLPEKRERQT